MRFYSWEYLLIFLPVLGYIVWFFFYNKKFRYYATIKYPSVNKIKEIASTTRINFRRYLIVLKIAALFFMILALARPQAGQKAEEIETKGIDIMLALDVSGSMQAEDFKPRNRLTVAKRVLADFIKGRKTDRIGLVVFAGESFTQCPLTLDYNIILEYLKQINFGMIEDGTAIGMAIANSVNRLRYSEAKSKVIVLLTDGENNAGIIDPITAANAAAAMNIKIYTVGVGKIGGAPIPYHHPIFGKQYYRNPDGSLYLTKLDEQTLKKIAQITGGKYFRATDAESLKKIYKRIDALEKTKIKAKQYLQYTEIFSPFLWIAIILILCYIILENLIFVKVP